MSFLCDFVYVLLVDDLEQHVRAERLMAATLIAGNAKPKGGGEITIPHPTEARQKFDRMLVAPLDIEEQRKAILRAVAAA